jgi:hypothetical protein
VRKEIAIRIISALLILLFTYAGVSKLAQHALFTIQLKDFPVIGGYALFLSFFVPGAELATVCLLFFPSTNLYGLYLSLFMLLAFTVFLVVMLAFDTSLPCSCGGVIAKLSWKEHVVFNLFFTALSATGIKLQLKMNRQQKMHLKSLLQ